MLEQNRSNLSRSIFIGAVGIAALAGIAYVATLPAAPSDIYAPADLGEISHRSRDCADLKGALSSRFQPFQPRR